MNKKALNLIITFVLISSIACGAVSISVGSSASPTPPPAVVITQLVVQAVTATVPEAIASTPEQPAQEEPTAVPPPTVEPTPEQAATEASAGHTSAPTSIEEFQITSDTISQKSARISGDTVVWFQPVKTEGVTTIEVYAYSLSSRSSKQLSQNGLYPVVSGDNVVWVEPNTQGQRFDFIRYQLASDRREVIFNSGWFDWSVLGSRYSIAPDSSVALANKDVANSFYDLSDQYLVWVDIKGEKYTIQAFDLASNQVLDVSSTGRYPMTPRLFGSTVVWSDDRGNGVDLFERTLPSGEDQQPAQVAGKKMVPAITNNYLVWLDVTHQPYKIWALNLTNGESWAITAPSAQPGAPRVDGDIVVWADTRNGNSDIYGYYLPSKNEFQITSGKAEQVWPDISNNVVVWMDNRGGEWDIFGANLSWK